MEKYILNVPIGIRFISDWNDFGKHIPNGKFIFNKVYPGCGMTTYFLTSDKPVIMAAPRRTLLDNKARWMEKHGYSYFKATTEVHRNVAESLLRQNIHSEDSRYI